MQLLNIFSKNQGFTSLLCRVLTVDPGTMQFTYSKISFRGDYSCITRCFHVSLKSLGVILCLLSFDTTRGSFSASAVNTTMVSNAATKHIEQRCISCAALSAITAEKQPDNSVMRSEGHDSLDNKGST